ncbi:hypothetical protein IMSHALPRED_007697 [Imshaugia aleurites]|uniref:Uncharacterized protein n=1 Tax=Imshaugia aleurites TaxID=172621 RepID=A0A8H3FVN5_9LECA|nr:hypothetical protein IMSHALPRED_007697 [Imshaugia aleurites]
MAGHLYENVVFTTSETNANGVTMGTTQNSLQDEFTPATALELELDLDFPVHFWNEFDHHIEWENYTPLAAEDIAAEASQEPYGYDDEHPEDNPLEPAFDASAARPESHSLPGFPHTPGVALMPQSQIFITQEPNSAFQDNTVDPAKLLTPAVEDDPSDLFGVSHDRGLSGRSEDLELPDNSSGLQFLQNLQLVGRGTQPTTSPEVTYNVQQLPHSTGSNANQACESKGVVLNGSSRASRDALAGSSEISPKNESRALLTNPRRRGATRRRPQNKGYIPNSAYTSLNQAPEKWDVCEFEYTVDGELDPSRLLSAEEIDRFLFNHYLHRGHRDLKQSPLTLRIQKTPASSAKRFPNGLKCRLKDCPIKLRTINQGQLLVIVDELSVRHPNHDPFLNAFYLHLWCLERYLNFPEICSRLNVTAKGRDARLERDRKNPFRLGLGEEERVVDEYVQAAGANWRRGICENPWVAKCPQKPTGGGGCPHYEQQSLSYTGTLCHQLVVTKLHYGGRGRINLRKDREGRAGYEGANITRHLGDLSKESELRDYSRAHRNQNQLKPNPKTGRIYREGERDGSHSGSNRPPTRQLPTVARPATKRDRDEVDSGPTLDHDIVQAHKKPRLKTPEWNAGRESHQAGTPAISPCTTLTHKSGRASPQLRMTAMSPSQDAQSAPLDSPASTVTEDESEGEIELEFLAAQRRRRALEIKDAKDKEKECKLRKLKLQKANEQKRARDEGNDYGDGTDSKGKRQKV